MEKTTHGWNIVDPTTPILTYEYSFGPGRANALAVGTGDGMVLVSPPCRVDAGVLDDVASYGAVRALVASNAFHYMGISEWKARFPEAAIFAPAQSIPRIEKQAKIAGVRPVSEATAITGDKVDLIDMPHYKTGEVMVRIKTAGGVVWYLTDILMNLPELPPQLLFRLMFKWTDSGPGLKVNKISPLFMVKNKRELYRWVAEQIDKDPPTRLIPAHGGIVELGDKAEVLRKLFVS
jgi:hypothetical protein